jgi:putative addiction module component (TIGR02574 family)
MNEMIRQVTEGRVDPNTVLQAVQAWPREDQLEFVFRVWDQLVDGDWQPELTDELKAELDRRLAAYQANPANVLTWEQVVDRT